MTKQKLKVRPPLSSEARERVKAIVKDLTSRHTGETMVYTTCVCNCGGNGSCVLKAHVKDGVVTAVEPDDRYNTNMGMEDKFLSEDDLVKNRLQRRACAKGLVFHKHLYNPNRILYPLKRAPGTNRGEGKYIRISWEEALTTIVNKMKEIREKYGPYSIITPYMPNNSLERLFEFWGAGVDSWGWCSYDALRLISHVMAGGPGWDCAEYASGSAADMLANSRLIVLWGFDPTMGHHGPGHQFAWFLKLARERGKPIIIIDPRYTVAAEVLADQWIPIKPGTDCAMFLAMAYVLFKENLYDRSFVAKYVEPVGFERWKNYVMGVDDRVKKTPEWAERICAVPAQTIRELTRIIAKNKPTWLWCQWGVYRKSQGEQIVKAFGALQAILGYWGIPGAGPALHLGPYRRIPSTSLGPRGSYRVPKMYRSHYWAQAVLLLDKVRNGELSGDEYRRMVGWKAEPSLLKDFNPKMLFWGGGGAHASDHLVTSTDSPNYQVKALQKMEFTISMHSQITPSVKYADIILPAQDPMWEEKNIIKGGGSYGGFESINYCPGVVKPPGEVRSWIWVYVKLAENLGIDPKKYFKYYTTDENWDRDYEQYLRDVYHKIVEYYKVRNINIPPWEEFTKGKYINCEELDEKPFTGWDDQIEEGKPFKTESGKIEIFSNYISNETNRGKGEHFDSFGRLYNNLPSDWSDLQPMPVYKPMIRGMDDPLVEKYPLMLLSPHCRYRVHYLFWTHPWLRNHVYRHRVWLSVVDAKVRGIRDGDMVQVYNDRGKVVMPTYVTSRIMPGLVLIHHGGRYEPNSSGVDWGASPSTLLGGDFKSCTTSAKPTTLVQVEKLRDE